MQDTFLKVRQHAVSLQQTTSLTSWIYRIARNEALMHLRKNKHNNTLTDESIWDEDTPLDIVTRSEQSEIIDVMLGRLKCEYREVLILRVYENLTYAEIATITGATESAVKSRLFKARKALSDKVKGYR